MGAADAAHEWPQPERLPGSLVNTFAHLSDEFIILTLYLCPVCFCVFDYQVQLFGPKSVCCRR